MHHLRGESSDAAILSLEQPTYASHVVCLGLHPASARQWAMLQVAD